MRLIPSKMVIKIHLGERFQAFAYTIDNIFMVF
ncbi:hypothetical protein BXY85_2035 [Roseivirga pacifica]|uniref:Uncharacterized protein n=1 Tax=Roseivirga pacifica TaxID=1267423 RepID=A0A1I0N8Z8_9BACT|nr:hypothetical protein BXY85_2035 [Roseivirga pacifica]SEV97653.1 hypothetical protein SAMN05216290_1017 [Roseivirga pacifica]